MKPRPMIYVVCNVIVGVIWHMPRINGVNHINMIYQATSKFYQVLLDNESGSQMQLLASVEQYCFEAASADRRHKCRKNIRHS